MENTEKLSGSNKGKSKNREKNSSDSCGQPTFREGPLFCEAPLRCGAIQVSSGVENGRWVLLPILCATSRLRTVVKNVFTQQDSKLSY